MRAVQIHAYGGPEGLKLVDVPVPEPGPGQALVKMAAIGVNFREIYERAGQYGRRELPYTTGGEGAGTVVALGPSKSGLTVGDRVVSTDFAAAYAEYSLAPVDRLVKIPDGLDERLAAAAMLQGMTAHYLTYSTYPLQPGETCLIHAAAGGVGLLLNQVAKRRGARVIGTVSTPEKADRARASGADDVILYTETDFAAEVKRLTDGLGVSVVYDSVGKRTFEQSLSCLMPRGYLVLFGQSSGFIAPVDVGSLSERSLFLTRPVLRDYVRTREDLLWRANDVLGWVAAGELRVQIGVELRLGEAAQAQSMLASRKTIGKVILIP